MSNSCRQLMTFSLELAVLIGWLALVSCGSKGEQSPFDHKVAAGVKRACRGSTSCTVHLGDYTAFRWDSLYVFDQGVGEDKISSVLGQSLAGYEDLRIYEVFLLGGRVVRQESALPSPDRPPEWRVVFDIARNVGYVRYGPEENLLATVEDLGGYKYFLVGKRRPR